MYQIEVKKSLVENMFKPAEGWAVSIHLDPMEIGSGRQNSEQKRKIGKACKKWMLDNGVRIGQHSLYGKTDFVAQHKEQGTYIIEAEGDASKQREQSFYSALGQLIFRMSFSGNRIAYGIAVPAVPRWEQLLQKIPSFVCTRLNIHRFLVSSERVYEL